jgi:hypothetical protein
VSRARRDWALKIGVEKWTAKDFLRSKVQGGGGLELLSESADFPFQAVTCVTRRNGEV